MAVRGVFPWMQACVVLLLCLSEAPSAAPETSANYYDTLNVEPTATDRQIKKAFRKLAIKYHPDKNKSTDAEDTFRDIAEAYTVLSNKEKRRLYDSVGHDTFLKTEASVDPEEEDETSFHFSFSDFFHDFDDSPFMESHFQWSFYQDEEDDDGLYEHYSFDGSSFSFLYGNEDENGDQYNY
ncbi:dnaJ homolog subfamily B member 9-like [Channa argus]|uniref:dnaJ homolog subfamily B member 9-like n=1 Tax=Channa argus TaxID=215402 RepID=UPI002944151C|nr:hypothetical protein Q8A73_005543 [Channa argus]